MTHAKQKYLPNPRMIDATQVASRLGYSVSWFHENRARLEAKGFPRRDTFFNKWDADTIELWFDSRAGIGDGDGGEQEWLGAVNG